MIKIYMGPDIENRCTGIIEKEVRGKDLRMSYPEYRQFPRTLKGTVDQIVQYNNISGDLYVFTHSEMIVHYLRLAIAKDPELSKEIKGFWCVTGQHDQEFGFSEEDERNWPPNFLTEAWEVEAEIRTIRQNKPVERRDDTTYHDISEAKVLNVPSNVALNVSLDAQSGPTNPSDDLMPEVLETFDKLFEDIKEALVKAEDTVKQLQEDRKVTQKQLHEPITPPISSTPTTPEDLQDQPELTVQAVVGFVNKRLAEPMNSIFYKMLREKLAELEHERWSNWQRHLHGQCLKYREGILLIPASSVKHWERQINTKYKDLTEREKDSDRKEADNTLKLLCAAYKDSQ